MAADYWMGSALPAPVAGAPCGRSLRRSGCGFGEQVDRGVDEREVRERLREVAEQAVRGRVVLLGVQPDVVGESEQAFEERRPRPLVARPSASASTIQKLHGEEHAFGLADPVDRRRAGS